MMRKIIGKIIELIIPRVEEGMEAEEGATEEGGEKPKTRVITLDQILGGGAQMAPKEPDLRVIGLYSDVSDEKIAELTQAIQQHIDLEMDEEVARGMAEHALGFFGFFPCLPVVRI